MARYSDILTDQNQVPLADVDVTVLTSAGGLATLTNDGGSSLSNPFITGATGLIVFNATDGVYTIEYRYGGKLLREDEINVGNPPQYKGDPGGNINATGPFSGLSTLSVPVGTGAITTAGSFISGRGRGRAIEVDNSYPVFAEAGRNIWWAPRLNATTRWLLDPEQRLTTSMFGARHDGTTDDIVALEQANAFCRLMNGRTLYFDAGPLFISRTLYLYFQINWKGALGNAFNVQEANLGKAYSTSTIISPAGVQPLLGYSLTDAAKRSDWNGIAKWPGCTGSSIDGVNFVSQGNGNAYVGINGVEFRARVNLRNMWLVGHGQHNLILVGSSDIDNIGYDGQYDPYGNVNGSTVKGVRSINAAQSGVYARGRDANNITFGSNFLQQNGGWGALDESLLGNSYTDNDFSNNNQKMVASANINVGSLCVRSAVAATSARGNYVEGGSGSICQLSDQSDNIGGGLAAPSSQMANTTAFTMSHGVATGAPFSWESSNNTQAIKLYSRLGKVPGDGRARVLSYGCEKDTADPSSQLPYGLERNTSGWWVHGSTVADFVQFPPPFATTGVTLPRVQAAGLPNGFFFGANGGGPYMGYTNTAPTGTTLPNGNPAVKGDRLTNSNITVGQPKGWGYSGTAWIAESNW